MNSHAKNRRQAGFSLIELTVTMGIMVAVLGITARLMADALRTATVTNETTEAQQSLRAVHEYLNRDLLVAGDGMSGLLDGKVRLPRDFVAGNITADPNEVATLERTVADNTTVYAAIPIITSDDAATRSAAAAGLRSGTDRVTMLTLQPDVGFPVSIVGGLNGFIKPDANTLIANVSATTAGLFRQGEVVLVSGPSGLSTLAAITGVTVNGASSQLRFASGDPYGLNPSNLSVLTDVVCGAGSPGTSTCNTVTVQRALLVTYFVDDGGLLRRRVLGKPRRGTIAEEDFTANAMAGEIIAEHVTELNARYGLIDSENDEWEIVDRMTLAQQALVRQVEVKLTAETPHPVKADGTHATATSVVRTSVRTMEYRNAL